MEKYSDYIIVHAATANELSDKVNQYMKDGWTLFGAPFSHATEISSNICQTLIKHDTSRSGMIGFNR